jgi:hypothetical protein
VDGLLLLLTTVSSWEISWFSFSGRMHDPSLKFLCFEDPAGFHIFQTMENVLTKMKTKKMFLLTQKKKKKKRPTINPVSLLLCTSRMSTIRPSAEILERRVLHHCNIPEVPVGLLASPND